MSALAILVGGHGQSLVGQAVELASIAWLAIVGGPETVSHARNAVQASRARAAARLHHHHKQETER